MDFEVLKRTYTDWRVSDFKTDFINGKTRVGLHVQLKNQLRTGFIWVLALSIIYALISFLYPEMIVIVFSILMIGFNVVVAYPMRRIYFMLNKVSETEVTVSYSKQLLDLYEQWYQYQKRMLKWALPLVTIYGGCLGAYSSDPTVLTWDNFFGPLGGILVVVSIPLSLLGNVLFKWMYRQSYGKKVAHLQTFYEELTKSYSETE